mmetsp:Transcript_58168/g.138463  ORF Transcript_58168/g.138463 Transcript_58168/m.138463 type:complete len:248 (+) Transcript_58168:144-887(+)
MGALHPQAQAALLDALLTTIGAGSSQERKRIMKSLPFEFVFTRKDAPNSMLRRPAKLIAITGGPGSGKSSIVQALKSRGMTTVPEAAIQIINDLNEELGVDGQKEWRRSHKDEFQLRVTTKQASLEASAMKTSTKGLAFCDRGLLDGLGYCRHFKQAVPADVAAIAEKARYDQVFLLETLPEEVFAARGQDGRTSGRQDSLAISRCIEEAYQEHGHTPVHVPVMPLEQRVAWVLEQIQQAGATAVLI